MAWGAYGKNSPDYTVTERPFGGNSRPATPVSHPAPVPVSAVREEASEYCPGCGKGAKSDFLVCPYCRFDLESDRASRRNADCRCGTARRSGAKFCHGCGTRH